MANVSAIKLPDNVTYNIKAGMIPYGEVDSTSTSTVYTATVPGITELKNGTIVLLRNGVVTSESGFTININDLGAKPSYSNMATGNSVTPTNPTRDTTIFNINYTMLFMYDEDLVSGGAWICYRGYDANTNTIGYQLRGNSSTRPAADKGYRYRIWLSSVDNQNWVPINISSSTNSTTTRSLNTRPIDPFGEIVYYSTNGTTNANANLTATTIWQQYALTIGYSYVKTLTACDPVYLKCEPQTTGGAIMKDIVQALPNSADGFIYIYLGIAYSSTSMELRFYHPVYYHDGNGIRAWTGSKIPTKTSELTNDSGFITSYTETDPIFSASAAAGISSTDITDWNNKSDFSGSYNDLTDKPTIPSIDGLVPNTTTVNGHALSSNVTVTASDIGVEAGALAPLVGADTTITPTQVNTAVNDGRAVSISYVDPTYGLFTFESFDSSLAIPGVVSSTVMEFMGSLYQMAFIGNTTTDTWSFQANIIAKISDLPTVPTNVSAFTNDAGYLTSYTETDPTVPAWAKAGTKPSYTASEVGALATTGGEVTGDITLKADAAANSKCLIFQRGTLSDNYNDWMIQDRGGYLYFDERGSGSSAWTNRVMFNTTGNVSATSFTGSGASLTNLNASNLASGTVPSARLDLSGIRQLPAVTSSDNGKILQVVNGAWAAAQLPSANGVSF